MVDLPLDGHAREVGDKALAQRVGAEGDDRAPVLVGLELEAHVDRAEGPIGQEPQQEPAAGLVAQRVPEVVARSRTVSCSSMRCPTSAGSGSSTPNGWKR